MREKFGAWKLWRESVEVDRGNEGKRVNDPFFGGGKAEGAAPPGRKSYGVLDKFQLCWGAQRIPALRRVRHQNRLNLLKDISEKECSVSEGPISSEGLGSAVNVSVNMLQKAVDNLFIFVFAVKNVLLEKINCQKI